MNAASIANPVPTGEYKLLEKKMHEIDSKLTSMFNRAVSLLHSINIVNLFLTIGSIALSTLATTAIALSGNPIHDTFVKCTMIFAATFGLLTIGVVLFVGMKSRYVVKNNPI